MPTTPINTVADIKLYAGITTTTQDALIQSLIEPCLEAIGSFCNRSFASADVTEYRDGNEASRMMLVNYPITKITSLMVDDRAVSPYVNAGIGYFYSPLGRALMLRGSRFARGMRNVVIQLTAGFGDAAGLAPWPADLKLAHSMYVVTRMKERDRLGVGSKTLAGESISYDGSSGTTGSSEGIPAAARGMLENYMNTVPESGQ